MKNNSKDYVTRILSAPGEVDAVQWNALLELQDSATPFMRHEYLAAMHESRSAVPSTGWTPRFVTLWRGDELHAACALYLKDHSYGEYVFDWAWADAYQRHGLRYYPKLLVAVPFTPVPGSRLMAVDEPTNRPAPMIPPKVIIETWRDFRLRLSSLVAAGGIDPTRFSSDILPPGVNLRSI